MKRPVTFGAGEVVHTHSFRTVALYALIGGPAAAVVAMVLVYLFFTTDARDVIVGGVNGLAIGTGMALFEASWAQGVFGRRVREASFTVVVLFKSVVWLAILVAGTLGPIIVLTDTRLVDAWNRPTIIAVVAGFALVTVLNFVAQVSRLLGRGVLLRFATGRYHRPSEEQRIFLFLDLQSSTATTERIGNLRFHKLLRRLIADMTGPILRSGGDIYRYVGDEVIVTWTMSKGLKGAACLRCYFEIIALLRFHEAEYRQEFGIVPNFWAGMHLGKVVTGEIGESKQEIVFLGDTMNTAERIEQACRTYQVPLLVSGALLSALVVPDDVVTNCLGDVSLPGVREEVQLYTARPRQ